MGLSLISELMTRVPCTLFSFLSCTLTLFLTFFLWSKLFKVKKIHSIPKCLPSKSKARRLRITSKGKGKSMKGPGGIKGFSMEDTGEEIDLELLLQDKTVGLHALDHSTSRMIFIKATPGEDLYGSYAFYDRAQSRNAEQIYVANYTDCFLLASRIKESYPLKNISYILNTGRCGSTLLHKLLLRGGVCSLSEPEWLMSLLHLMHNPEVQRDTILKLVECCNIIAFSSARLHFPEANLYSMNPKAFCGRYLEYIKEIFPEVKIVFMRRECTKVVESFSSLMGANDALWKKILFFPALRLLNPVIYKLGLSSFLMKAFISPRGLFNHMVPATGNIIEEQAFLKYFGSVKPLAYLWAVCWIVQNGLAERAKANGTEMLFLNYEDLVGSKEEKLREVWGFLGIPLTNSSLAHVLDGFNEHSQESEGAMRRSRPRYLTDREEKIISNMAAIPLESYVPNFMEKFANTKGESKSISRERAISR